MADRMISQVKLYYEQIKERFEELGTVTLSLEVHPQIQPVLAQGFDIGKVICRKERDCFSRSRMEKPLKECQIEMVNVVKIKGLDDTIQCYRGVAYLQGDQVKLTDSFNKRVILLNSSYQYIDSFTLPGNPWNVCVVDHHEVAVSLPSQKTLQFLCITKGAIKPTRMVNTRYICRGVASAGNGQIAVSSESDNKGKCYWSLIENTGKETFFSFDCQHGPSTTYIAFNSSCTRVYLTVWQADSLYCFGMDGKMMYTYRPDSLKSPYGIATDRDDNVYVVGWGSNNIHQLTSDGTPIRIITEGIPCGPTAICFNSSFDRLFITNDPSSGSDSISVYRLK